MLDHPSVAHMYYMLEDHVNHDPTHEAVVTLFASPPSKSIFQVLDFMQQQVRNKVKVRTSTAAIRPLTPPARDAFEGQRPEGQRAPTGVPRAVGTAGTGSWNSGWEAMSGGYKALGGPLGTDGSGWQY